MPNLVDKIKLKEKQDRRGKLLTEDKEKIRELYATGKYSLNNLAKQYNVSKKLIHITVNPEALKKSKEYTKKTWKKYKSPKEVHAKAIKKTRDYKRELHENGEFKKQILEYYKKNYLKKDE